jgi:sugar/nucleoside kinase (ribokinase family)
MKTPRQSRSSLVALAAAVVVTLLLVACQQSQPPATTPSAAESKAATAKDVFVVFEGPWAIVPDPKDANSVLLLAPKTKAHRDLYVTASNNSTLTAGTYDLSVPGRTGTAAGAFDESILRAKIDPKNVQRVLDDKSSNRYAIRLPKPDAYLPASRHRSRVSATYPPEPATEKEYATGVSLRYSVSSLTGFSLAGTPDRAAFNPLLLQVETPTIRFVIDPAHEPDPADKCNTHSRQSFHDAATLLSLNLYVDFPESPSTCHDTDPQKARATKAETGRTAGLERLVALLESDLGDAKEASVAPLGADRFAAFALRGAKTVARHLSATLYLFGRPQGICIAPVIAADGS